MQQIDFSQITTLEAYYANQEAVDARLAMKSTNEDYEANKVTIFTLSALKDCNFIFETLKMKKWYSLEGEGAYAYCTPAFWKVWRRDRIQIDSRALQVDKRNGRYILFTYHKRLVDLLIGTNP